VCCNVAQCGPVRCSLLHCGVSEKRMLEGARRGVAGC